MASLNPCVLVTYKTGFKAALTVVQIYAICVKYSSSTDVSLLDRCESQAVTDGNQHKANKLKTVKAA